MELKDIYISFTIQEKIALLQSQGFEVKKEYVKMTYTEYHNQVSYEDQLVWTVRKDGKHYREPLGYSFRTEEWVDSVFQEVFEKIFKERILPELRETSKWIIESAKLIAETKAAEEAKKKADENIKEHKKRCHSKSQ